MERLTESITSKDWEEALTISGSLNIEPSYVHKHILSDQLLSHEYFRIRLNIESLRLIQKDDPIWISRLIINYLQNLTTSYLSSIENINGSDQSGNELWVDSEDYFRTLFDILKESTETWVRKFPAKESLGGMSIFDIINQNRSEDEYENWTSLKDLIENDPEIEEACSASWISYKMTSKLKLYGELFPDSKPIIKTDSSKPSQNDTSEKYQTDLDGIDESAWHEAELNLQIDDDYGSKEDFSIPFLKFLCSSLKKIAKDFGSTLQLGRLRHLISAETVGLDPFEILDLIPLHARPSDLDYGEDLIALLPRPTSDYPSKNSSPNILSKIFDQNFGGDLSLKKPADDKLTEWYLRRVHAIDELTGCTDAALEFVQHGAAAGVTGLELIAEDLSLLAKLLYEAPLAESDYYHWSLNDWESKTTEEVLGAYLSGSSPSSLMRDIQRLALPYLGVMESRRTRLSIPGAESTIPDAIRTWALSQSNNLSLLLTLIKASSPTLKTPQRTIKSNEELARIAISCLYTSSKVDDWECMGQIYECMPAFPEAEPPPEGFDSAKFLRDKLASLTSLSLSGEGAQKMYEYLLKINTGCLSVILDALDAHLTAAEVLATWNVPTRLAEIVTKYQGNRTQQEQLAIRIARQEDSMEMEEEEEWESLLEAMVELSRPGQALDLLEKSQVIRLFFSGLLSTGKFNLARALFATSNGERPLDTDVQEELVIAASREFYDNADSGNLHNQDVKMAFDCLSAAPQTLQIRREREFIEATSRLSSFRLESQPGILMSPIEVRLKPNKLDIIQQILKTNETAYQHPDLMIELTNKLQYGENVLDQTKTMSMIVESALTKGDFIRASETCERMVVKLEEAKKASRKSEPWEKVEKVSEIVWKICERLGRFDCNSHHYNHHHPHPHQHHHSERHETKEVRHKQTKFLGNALIICPAEEISGLLNRYREIEDESEEDNNYNNVIEGNKLLSDEPVGLTKTILGGVRSLNIVGNHSSNYDSERSQAASTAGASVSSTAVNLSGELASLTLGRAVSLFPFKSNRNSSHYSAQLMGKRSDSTSSSPPINSQQIEERNQRRHNFNNDHEHLIKNDEDGRENSNSRDFSMPLSNLIGGEANDGSGFRVGADRLTTALSNKFTSGVGWLIGANEDDLAQ